MIRMKHYSLEYIPLFFDLYTLKLVDNIKGNNYCGLINQFDGIHYGRTLAVPQNYK